MFENLKAFIRHGKHANEKHTFADIPNGFQDYTQSRDDDLVNLPSNISEFKPTTSDATLTGDVTERKYNYESQPSHNSQYQQQQQTRNEELASQIVEQELQQKRKLTKYPNLDNYEVMEQLGEGAFSIVYKAKNLQTGQFVAIKILRKFQMDQPQKQAVLKEVTIMRQLDNPHIVKFVEFIDSDPYYYIVQELVTGGEIFAAIVNYTYLSEDLSRHIIIQVAKGIRYLHEEVGIVHRDIKPENLLYYPVEFKPSSDPASKLRRSDDPNSKKDEGEFTPGVGGGTIGVVKLADFGLSKQIWEHNTKTPCGTVGYTAPEIVRDERYSKEVDMWAIGCVLYTLLCGFPPFYDERIDTLTEKVAKGEYTFLSPWWDEISAEAKNCVSRLLTVDPNKRYTINEFLKDPWINKHNANMGPPVSKYNAISSKHPIQDFNNRYSKKYSNDLYSPAAVALRDAFDISTAVHRMGEEAKLTNPNQIGQAVIEEEEEEDVTSSGRVIGSAPHKRQHQYQQIADKNKNLFELNLGGASILERRKHKPVMIPS